MSDLLQVPFKLTGTRPLLMHNSRLADPLDDAARALASISGKRNKTIEDHEAMARAEFMGSLYFSVADGPFVPSTYVERSVSKAASLMKKRGKDIDRSLTIESDMPIVYAGPRDLEGLYADRRFHNRSRVKIGQQAVMRTRPQFNTWELNGVARLDASILDESDFKAFLNGAGVLIGIGDWRPKFGLFDVSFGTTTNLI